MNQDSKPSSLFPHGIGELNAHHIASQVYQGLVKLNQQTLEVENCLAEKVDVNEDATVYTYHLRKGVFFHDDDCFEDGKGREVKAHDFKYCLDQLCTPMDMTKTKDNQIGDFVITKVKGAKQFYNACVEGNVPPEGVEGINVIDDYTLEIVLAEPFAGFNKIMATAVGWVYPKEAVEVYGEEMRTHMVGTGPFISKLVDFDDHVFLQRNEHYWEVDSFGNELPYLDGLKYSFLADKQVEFNEFNKGNLDMVWPIPVDEIDNLMKELKDAKSNAKQKLQSTNGALAIQYYAFLQSSKVFSDIRIRKAFCLAIDRNELVNYTLNGEGEPAVYGIVPPMEGYPSDSINGYKGSEADIQEANRLLAEAGYENGVGFPQVKLQLNLGGNVNLYVAQAVENQLKENLGVSVQFEILPMNQHRLKYETGKTDFWRISWVADYPDPENFLNYFHSKYVPDDVDERSYYNATRYINPEFDALYDRAIRTIDKTARMNLFAQADQLLINDAVVMPLYYDSYQRLIAKNVMNFPMNGMEYRDFTRVFFDMSEAD